MSRRVGTSPSSTNPVRNVPVIAPAVPTAESRPTIEPLVSRSVKVARTIIGPTADRIAAGSTNPTAARITIARNPLPRSAPPRAPTIGTAAIAATPPSTNDGPSNRSGPSASAARPPIHAPSAIPARIAPMIPVYVVSDTPTYGASSRPAAISRTSTQAVPRKVRTAATGQGRRHPRRSAPPSPALPAGRGSDKRGDLPGEPLGQARDRLGVGGVEPQGHVAHAERFEGADLSRHLLNGAADRVE